MCTFLDYFILLYENAKFKKHKIYKNPIMIWFIIIIIIIIIIIVFIDFVKRIRTWWHNVQLFTELMKMCLREGAMWLLFPHERGHMAGRLTLAFHPASSALFQPQIL